MPAIRVPSSRIQRHFSPLTVHTVFKQEQFRDPPRIDFQIYYSIGSHKSNNSPNGLPSSSTSMPKRQLIPKPSGEVSRLARGGYNLRSKLEWEITEYKARQVSLMLSIFIRALTLLQIIVRDVANNILDTTETWAAQKATKKNEFLKAVCLSLCSHFTFMTRKL